jgi:hypothetical protein
MRALLREGAKGITQGRELAYAAGFLLDGLFYFSANLLYAFGCQGL